MAERDLPKVETRVRFPSPAPHFPFSPPLKLSTANEARGGQANGLRELQQRSGRMVSWYQAAAELVLRRGSTGTEIPCERAPRRSRWARRRKSRTSSSPSYPLSETTG